MRPGIAVEKPWARHVYHVYTLRAASRNEDRDGLQAALASEGIQTAIHYGTPVHLQPAFADLGYAAGSLPQSEAAAREVLSLPIYPELSEESVHTVCRAVKKVLSGKLTNA